MTAVSPATRALVLERDGFQCISCWHGIRGPFGYSLQHRTPRGMGGSSRPESNSPANLVTLCGSATTGCHGFVESHRTLAETWGYLVRRGPDPATVPVLTAGGWVLYDADACLTYTDPPEGEPSPTDQYLRYARDIRTAKGDPV